MRAAEAVLQTWDRPAADAIVDDMAVRLRAAARTEFARHGYEATTVRDIAAAVGIYSGSIYRFVESKEALCAPVSSNRASLLIRTYPRTCSP
jgi:AcrR family transcriptional regulator